MIAAILPYVSSYDDVRAVTGLNTSELPDVTLALATYKNYLGMALDGTAGVYPPSVVDQTLQEMFDALPADDPMSVAIQQFSIYTVADSVMGSVGLRAYKTQSDGKSTVGRFSPESAYLSAKQSIKDFLNKYIQDIGDLLGDTKTDITYLAAVKPDIDPVTGV